MRILFLILILSLNAAAFAQSLNFVGSYNSLAYVGTVSVQNNYAYIGAYSGIHIVDISDPVHPFRAGRVSNIDVMTIRAMGDYAYVGTDDAFKMYNISDPINPYLIGSSFVYYPLDFFLYSHYAYVSENREYYKIFDISNPDSFNLVGYFEGIACGDGCIAHDSLAYLADWDGLRVWNLSDPVHPSLVGYLSTSGNILISLAIEGNTIFAIAERGPLFIIDISNPVSPAIVHLYLPIGYPWSVALSGNYVYLAEDTSGIEVIDKSDPANPTFAASYNTPGNAYEICVIGDYVYVADYSSLQILRFYPTGIEEKDNMPGQFSLSQNYPNPFNASTSYEYNLPHTADIKLSVFNLQGQKIAILFDGQQTAGLHKLTWNADGYPSGIYFARLEANGMSKVIKSVVLK